MVGDAGAGRDSGVAGASTGVSMEISLGASGVACLDAVGRMLLRLQLSR